MHGFSKEVVGQIPLQAESGRGRVKNRPLPGETAFGTIVCCRERSHLQPMSMGGVDEDQWLFPAVGESHTSTEIIKLSQEDLGRRVLVPS